MRSFAEHLAAPTNQGALKHHPHSGAAGGAPCGDLVRIAVQVEGDRVTRAGFDAEGCGATTAAASAIVESIEGRSFLNACRLNAEEVARLLGGLIPGKRHAAELAADALHRALGAAAKDGAARMPEEPAPHARRDERGCRLRRRGSARARRRRRGRGRHARAVVRSGHRRREELLLSPGRARRARARPSHGHPASHARPARALPRGGRGRLPRRLRRRPHPQPLRALQRRGPLRRDARARRGAGRRSPRHRPLRAHRP